MKPKFPAFPRRLVLTTSAVMAVFAPLGTFAADFTWKGGTDSDWATGGNWLLGTAPTYGATLTTDRLVIGNGANAGAVYNPPSGETTTFGSGRGIIIGSTTQGAADLTVSSGTLKINGTGADPAIMANGVSASVLINGGSLDLTGHPTSAFRFFGSGSAGLTSNLTISSGSFSSKGFDFHSGGTAGAGTIDLNGGSMAVTAFTRPSTAGSTILNLNGGTLRIRNASSSSFLPDLVGLQTIVKVDGAVIDSDTFDMTIAEVLEHDSTLGVDPDGGLTKNGAGTLVLTGANTFDGGLTINAGVNLTPNFNRVTLDNDSAAGTGTITLADSYAELRLFAAAGARNIANPLVISNTGDEKSLIFTQAGGATCSGQITINDVDLGHFRVRSDNSNMTFSGKITGAGGIHKYGGNTTLLLTNGTNDFTGGVKNTIGTIDFVPGALGTAGSIIMDGGILRWSTGNTEDVSARIVMEDAKNATFSTNGNDVNFANPIGNSSTASFVKSTTSGTLTLNGTNTYTGTTTVGGGTLKLAAGATFTASASLTLGAGTALDTTEQSTYSVPAAQPISFAINAGGGGSAGRITAAGLDVSDATVTYNISGTPDDPVYVLATYTGTLAGPFQSVPAPPTGYTLKYDHEGDKIALVEDAVSGFAAWQSANGTPGGLDEDHDGDSVSNGIEFFIYGPVANSGFTALPGVTDTAGVLSVTWTKAAGYTGTYGSGFVVETSDTLTGAWTTEKADPEVGFTVTFPTATEVKYTFPAGTKKFARLKVTGP